MSTKITKCPTCGADAINRSEFWEAAPENGHELEQLRSKLSIALGRYHLALDRHQHAGVAAGALVAEVERLLDEPWQRGVMLERFRMSRIVQQIYGNEGRADQPVHELPDMSQDGLT